MRDENGVDVAAQNHVKYWLERQVSFRGNSVLRLLFLFEMLVCAFDFQQVGQITVQSFRQSSTDATEPATAEGQTDSSGWGGEDEEELQGWREALEWWVGKCGFCAGQGLTSSHIDHTMETCIKGGSRQLKVRLGEAIHLEGFKASSGCPGCGIPREFCDKWVRISDGTWRVIASKSCKYGSMVYNTVIGLYQCSDRKYAMGLLDTILEEGDPEYRDLSDEDVALWLCKGIEVEGLECSEIIRQLWVWTGMVQKNKTKTKL